jgi:hypothetical protein
MCSGCRQMNSGSGISLNRYCLHLFVSPKVVLHFESQCGQGGWLENCTLVNVADIPTLLSTFSSYYKVYWSLAAVNSLR